MCIDDQDEKIKLEALLGGIWPQNAFMIELARKTPTTFCELQDRINDFVNAEYASQTLIASKKVGIKYVPNHSNIKDHNWVQAKDPKPQRELCDKRRE